MSTGIHGTYVMKSYLLLRWCSDPNLSSLADSWYIIFVSRVPKSFCVRKFHVKLMCLIRRVETT